MLTRDSNCNIWYDFLLFEIVILVLCETWKPPRSTIGRTTLHCEQKKSRPDITDAMHPYRKIYLEKQHCQISKCVSSPWQDWRISLTRDIIPGMCDRHGTRFLFCTSNNHQSFLVFFFFFFLEQVALCGLGLEASFVGRFRYFAAFWQYFYR